MRFEFQNKLFITRNCKKSDYRFFYTIMKETMFPLISQYKKIDLNFFRLVFFKKYSKIQILLRGKKRVGFFQFTEINKSTLDIEKLFLSKGYRGKGLGSHILKDLETKGYKKLTLQVWDNNPARKLYKKLGYKQILKKNHKITMEKVL